MNKKGISKKLNQIAATPLRFSLQMETKLLFQPIIKMIYHMFLVRLVTVVKQYLNLRGPLG